MTYQELLVKNVKELEGLLGEARAELHNLRAKLSVGQVRDVRSVRETRQHIAHIQTALTALAAKATNTPSNT